MGIARQLGVWIVKRRKEGQHKRKRPDIPQRFLMCLARLPMIMVSEVEVMDKRKAIRRGTPSSGKS